MGKKQLYYLISIGTIFSFGLYIVTDVAEALMQGFTPLQLMLTYVAMAGIPFAVMGLYAVHFDKGGIAYLVGLLCYGISYVYFAHSALMAYIVQSDVYHNLVDKLGTMYMTHGYIMVFGALLVGYVIIKNGIFNRWTGALILSGTILSAAGVLLSLPDIATMAGNTVRNLGFIGMGFGVFRMAKDM